MITALLLLAATQQRDTVDMDHVLRSSIVAAYGIMKRNSFVQSAPHIRIDVQSMRQATGTSADFSSSLTALGSVGTIDDRRDCGNGERCPIIKVISVTRSNDSVFVRLVLNQTRTTNGRTGAAFATYKVTLARRNGVFEVVSASVASIT